MEVLMEYHLIFIIVAFVIFLITMFLLFIEPKFETTVASFIFIMFNMLICIINSLSFFGIGIYGMDGTGTIVMEAYHGMGIFSIIFLILFYINFLLLFYCIYLFYKKPWKVVMSEEEERFYQTVSH